MNKEEFVRLLEINETLQPKRCTEKYLQKHNLIEHLNNLISEEFGTVSERIKFLKYGGGYCLVCGIRTSIHVSGKGFSNYCKSHFHEPKKNKIAHNHIHLDSDLLIDLYVNQKKSVLEMGKLLDVSNSTIKNKLDDLGIEYRSHSENQKLHAKRGYTKPRIIIDREQLRQDYKINKIPIKKIAEMRNCSEETIRRFLVQEGIERTNRRSYIEWKFIDIFKKHNINYESNNKKLIEKYEIDFYLPEYNLGLEINGLYTHSVYTGKKDKLYHNTKYNLSKANGITLLQFWENDINDKLDIIESMLLNKCNRITNKIDARKCEVVVSSYSEAKPFYENNHILGAPSKNSKTIALKYKGDTVAAIAYKEQKDKTTITRYCNLRNSVVRGGFTRLLNNIPTKGMIITYSANDISEGNLYRNNGFELIKETKYDMWYTDYRNIYSRERFMKKNLSKLFENYNDTLSETDNMINNGYDVIYKSGTKTWRKS